MNQFKESGFDHLSPSDERIRVHRCIQHIPKWSEEDPRFLAICDALADEAPLEAIKLTREFQIVDADSRERWRAVRRMQLDEMPVVFIPTEMAELVAISTLTLRRHLTKSAIAYLAFPMLQPAFEASRRKRLENLKKPNVSRKSPAETIGTVEAMAERLGIMRNLMFEAKKVHDLFAKDADYKAQMEPRILAEPIGGEHEEKRPVGLGAVIAGYKGRALKGEERPDRGQLDLFERGFCTFVGRANSLVQGDKFPPEARQSLQAMIAEMSPVVRAELKAAINKLEKEEA